MATLHWQRDIGSDISGVKNTFSGWDQCMAKAYCKWPAIIGIIIGSLIVLSIVWCIARCLCCGAECCCGCLSCCNACCPSPRGSKNNGGYQQAPPTPAPFYNQYQPPPGPMYASGAMGGYRSGNVAQTATFDAPSKNGRFNEDALPAMPSWDNASSRREEVMEMEKLNEQQTGHTNGPADGMMYQNPEPTHAYGHQQGQHGQQESLLPQQDSGRYYNAGQRSPSARQDFAQQGDMGGMTAQPYSDYQNQRQHQFSPGPYGTQNRAPPSPYSPTVPQPVSPAPQYNAGGNTDYYGATQSPHTGYQPSIPPSYHTRPPSDVVSPLSPQASYPGQSSYQAYGSGNSGVGRKPVQGSWREV